MDCLTEESECNDESPLDDLRSELGSGERGKPYCGCGYYLSEVDLEPLVKPKKTDAEFLRANGIDLSVYDENEEDGEERLLQDEE